jgi:primosomal protein N' (replication factor Y)
MSDFEKVEVWRKIKTNEIQILIGTRSSLFLPFQNLGLIIVDEEHDNAYKPREVKPYFNAKDAAQVLAKFYDAKVILGSATPSVESYFAAKNDKLKYVFLGKRFGEVALPKYEIINFKEAQESKLSVGHFSQILIDKISENLQNKKQSIILAQQTRIC